MRKELRVEPLKMSSEAKYDETELKTLLKDFSD